MPPFAAPVERDGSRQRHAAAAGVTKLREVQRSASFHRRGAADQQQRHLPKQRPRTQPDLLAGVRGRSFRRATEDGDGATMPTGGRPAAPSKVLVTVTVLRSMWPLHVMACTGWRSADLVAATVELYVREGRRPLLPSADPSAFGLHYSQFSLQSLDPEEKLMELGSRSFFLCPKASATAAASSTCSSAEAGKATSASVREPNTLLPWLGFMHFWPLM